MTGCKTNKTEDKKVSLNFCGYDKNIATETKFQFSFRIPMFAVGEHNKFLL